VFWFVFWGYLWLSLKLGFCDWGVWFFFVFSGVDTLFWWAYFSSLVLCDLFSIWPVNTAVIWMTGVYLFVMLCYFLCVELFYLGDCCSVPSWRSRFFDSLDRFCC